MRVHRWWLEPAMRLGFIGCYAQTELGHGNLFDIILGHCNLTRLFLL